MMTNSHQAVLFRHLVGRSTLAQGITIRRDFETAFSAPAAGQAREITLVFDEQSARVTLRRLANESGTVQIRYEGRRSESLRNWLRTTFSESPHGPMGDVLELHRTDHDVYRLVAITGPGLRAFTLCPGAMLTHNNADHLPAASQALSELREVLGAVAFAPGEGQSHYNAEIKKQMVARQWQTEVPVVPELGLQCDYRRDECQVEVEFGNARSYYQNYLKFLVPFTRGIIRLGILVVPTADFASLLCAAGARRALARRDESRVTHSAAPKYSGMITYDKVAREFEVLKFLLTMPLLILGVDYWGDASESTMHGSLAQASATS